MTPLEERLRECWNKVKHARSDVAFWGSYFVYTSSTWRELAIAVRGCAA